MRSCHFGSNDRASGPPAPGESDKDKADLKPAAISRGEWEDFLNIVPALHPYFITTCTGRLLDANERLATLLGCASLDELFALAEQGDGTGVFCHEHGQRKQILELIRSKGCVHDFPVILRCLNGEPVRCFLFARVFDNDLNTPCLQGFILDRGELHAAYRAVVDFYRLHERFLEVMPIPSAYLDSAGVIKANRAFAGFFGVGDALEMAGRNLSAYVHPQSRRLVEAWCSELIGENAERDVREADLRLTFLDGRYRQVIFRGVRMVFDDRPVVLCTIDDQTEHREVRRALDLARRRIFDILRNAPVGFAEVSRNHRYVEVNHYFAAMHGYDSPEEMLESVRDIGTQIYADFEEFLEFGRRLEKDGVVHDFKCLSRRRDGSLFWTSRSARMVCRYDESDFTCECYVIDIDAATRAEMLTRERERRIRGLSVDLLRTTERERRQLAKNLHDGPMQLLAVSKIMLERMSDNPLSSQEDADAVSSLVARSLEMMRTSMVELCPPALFEEDIEAMFAQLAQEFEEAYGLEVVLDCHKMPAMTTEAKAFLFRSAREFLVNAVKHGHAGRASLRLGAGEGNVVLEVVDDGRGRSGGDGDQARSLGLPSLRRRAADLGGRLDVDLKEADGARVVLSLPLDVLTVRVSGA